MDVVAAGRLSLQVGRREVRILISGQERLALVAGRAYRGFHPAELLDPDLAPLRPARPAARIAVYGCSCGHTGCGCVAPLISQAPGQVIWSDFRDFTGVYDGPVSRQPPPADAGQRLPLPDTAFGAQQYLAEVDRATADRWWETPPLLAARLLRGHLNDGRARLADLGWTREYLWPARRPGVYHLALQDADGNQICLDLTATTGPAQDQARQLADFVLGTSPLHWPVAHCSFCERPFEPSPGRSQDDHNAQRDRHPAHAPAPQR